jgi:hypothetical protein
MTVLRTTCPYCGEHHDRITTVADEEQSPRDGDATLCWACGLIALLDSTTDEGTRKPTRKEQREMDRDPRFTRLRAGWKMFKRDRSVS